MIKFLLHGGLSHHPEPLDDNHMLGLSSGLLISKPGLVSMIAANHAKASMILVVMLDPSMTTKIDEPF